MRSKAQQWNDGRIDSVIAEYKRFFGVDLSAGVAMQLIKIANDSLGMTLVCLQKIKAWYGDTPPSNLHGAFRNRIKRNNLWLDSEWQQIKDIDRGYERKFDSNNDKLKQIYRKLGQ